MSDAIAPAVRPRVLLVEDNDNDVELTKLAFAEADPAAEIRCVVDGEQCMATLRQSAVSDLPDLILLDLHMPRMSGLDVLTALARDDTLKAIPVIVLTTSDAPEDICAAYRAGCRSYLLKPFGFQTFVALIKSLTQYWFGVVRLPTTCCATTDAIPPRAPDGTNL